MLGIWLCGLVPFVGQVFESGNNVGVLRFPVVVGRFTGVIFQVVQGAILILDTLVRKVNQALIRKSWLIQKKFADLRYERKGFIAFLAPAYMWLNGRHHKGYRPMPSP